MRYFYLPVLAMLARASCEKRGSSDINPFLSTQTSIPFTMECTKKDDHGNCLEVECKKDADSGCSLFASGCLKHDGYFKGSDEGGTCTRIM